MSRCVRIFSRDRESCEVVEQILGNGKHRRRAEFCPDVAFMLDGVKPERLDLQPPLNGAVHGLLVGLNINGLVYHGGYTRNNMFALRCDYKLFVKQLVMRLLQDTAIRLLLVPHTFAPGGDVNSDTMACQEVLQTLPESLRSRVHLVARPYDQHEIKGIIGLCGFFIGSRMHACIAALSQSIPTVGVAYSRKFKGVFDVVGCKDMVVEARFVDTEAAVQIVCQHLQNRARTGKFLHERLIAAQKRISEVFQELLIQE
jgi:polysaccharide pyruvyl transferase WcaK-like protein